MKSDQPSWPRWVMMAPLLLVGIVSFPLIRTLLGSFWPTCPLREVTGQWCVGCGGTRCLKAMASFDFPKAAQNNLWLTSVLLVSVPMIVLMGARRRYPRAQFLQPFRWKDSWTWSLVLSLLFFGILRNLEAFSWLAPGTR